MSASSSKTLKEEIEKTHQPKDSINEEKIEEEGKGNEEEVEEGKGDEVKEEGNGDEEEEEEGECGFCVFMKGGGCKDTFIAWEDCIKEVEDNKEVNIAEKCFEVTSALRKCMDLHADYYEPILRAEKDMEEEANKELGKEYSSTSKEESAEREVIIEVPQSQEKQ